MHFSFLVVFLIVINFKNLLPLIWGLSLCSRWPLKGTSASISGQCYKTKIADYISPCENALKCIIIGKVFLITLPFLVETEMPLLSIAAPLLIVDKSTATVAPSPAGDINRDIANFLQAILGQPAQGSTHRHGLCRMVSEYLISNSDTNNLRCS